MLNYERIARTAQRCLKDLRDVLKSSHDAILRNLLDVTLLEEYFSLHFCSTFDIALYVQIYPEIRKRERDFKIIIAIAVDDLIMPEHHKIDTLRNCFIVMNEDC